MILAKRQRRFNNTAYTAGRVAGKVIKALWKRRGNIKFPRFQLRNKNKQSTAVVPSYYGRSLVRVPLNLNAKMKKGLKHCNNLVSKKLMLFKNSVIQRTNRIFYFMGMYKGYSTRFDNEQYIHGTGVARINPAFKGQGGALGFGMNAMNESAATTYGENFEYTPGNAFICALEMVGCQTLPFRFKNNGAYDLYQIVSATNRDNRQFAFCQDAGSLYGQKKLFCLNNVEDQNTDGGAPFQNFLTFSSQTTNPRLYTLSYKYTFDFQNTVEWPMRVQMFWIKFDGAVVTDFNSTGDLTFGLSNFINKVLKQSSEDSRYSTMIEQGKLPGNLFKVIKKREFTLGGLSSFQANERHHGDTNFKRRIVIKSKKHFIAMAQRNTDGVDPVVSTSPNSSWYDQKVERLTYLYVHAFPAMIKPANTNEIGGPTYTAANIPNTIMYKVTKENSFCVIDE